MAISDGDYLRVAANFELGDGTQYQNIYYYTRDGTDPYSDAAHIAAIKADLDAAYQDIEGWIRDDVTEQLSFVDKLAWDGVKWAVTENVGTFTVAFTPGVVSQGLPWQVSPYVTFKTLRPKTVGKKFLFPFGESAQADSLLLSGTLADVVDYAAQVMATINLGGDATLTPGVVRTGVNQWLSFLVAVASDLLGTQRRRKRGVGA